jgi:hypothetical protein
MAWGVYDSITLNINNSKWPEVTKFFIPYLLLKNVLELYLVQDKKNAVLGDF